MTADIQPDRTQSAGHDDASRNALKREQRARQIDPQGIPVKQHNPGEQGLNPDQKGPAQPDDANQRSRRADPT